MNADLQEKNRVFPDRIAQLAEHTLFGLAGTVINSSVIVVVLWKMVDKTALFLWFAALLITSIGRLYLQQVFPNHQSDNASLNRWKRYFLVTLAISGIVWGAAGIVLFPVGSVAHQAFIAFVLGGMVAGSVGVFSALITAFLCFSIPAMLPLIIRSAAVGDLIHLSMSFMLALFWAIMFFTAKKLNKDLLKTFTLKYENTDLIAELNDEIDARKKIAEELKQKKDEIEKIVDIRTLELQEANKELQKSEEKYRQLVENINDVIYSVTPDGTISYISPAVESVLGYRPSEVIGKKIVEYIHKDDLETVMTRFQQVLDGIYAASEYRLLSKNDEYVWVRSSSRSVYENDRVSNLTGAFIDISERKRLETQRAQLEDRLVQAQKMESIGTLAGGIAHNFNNILAAIIGFTELALADAETDSDLQDNLQEIYTASLRARNDVRQILAFARQSEEMVEPIQVNAVAAEVIGLVGAAAPSTIDIKSDIHSDSLVRGSVAQLHQVLMNVCTNAVQAMEDGGGILTLTVEDIVVDHRHEMFFQKLAPGEYVKIQVSDTGVGISGDHIHSIFDPYFTTRAVGEGVGMGLAVAHGIIESYGGKITVHSETGKGALFTIYLPMVAGRRDAPSVATSDLPRGAEHILFVDDEAPLAKMGALMLEQLGYSVTAKTCSLEALELLRAKPDDFDLVITDMTMPDLTGDKLAAEIRATRKDIPVILCTGYSRRISEKSAAQIGIKAFAYKPIVKADLAKTVRKVLDEAQNTAQA